MLRHDDSKRNFEEAIYLIVADCFNASSQKFTLAEQMATAKTWTRILFGTVPENRLEDVLDLAFQKHETEFIINAYEFKNRWIELEAEDKAAAAKLETEERTLNRVAYCPDKHHHKSADEALQEYQVGADFVWLPCAVCRRDAYWQRVKDIKATMAAEKTPENIISEMPEFEALVSGLRLVK